VIKLRDYQERAIANIFREWEEVQSTLLVHPTGVGKTTIFTEVVWNKQPERALVLAHREELIFQAKRRIEDQTGLEVATEMAEEIASTNEFLRAPVVVATVQTLISGFGGHRRMHKFNPHEFGLLIIDEGHHSTAASYRKIIDHFSQNHDLKILGVTATPDRHDEEALGQIFDTVADVYEIRNAIKDGWLVPIDQQMVSIDGLDYSQVRTTAGDLNGKDLAIVMESEKNLQGVCGSTLDIIRDRRTIVFTSSVKHAEMACNIFNRHRTNMAEWVCGWTPKEERRLAMKKFHSGDTQVLCNVGIVSEGVDVPAAEVCVMARPTKSRALYAQMAGRILRPIAEVDKFNTPVHRRLAIQNSVKPAALVVDFVGNSGRHRLISAADILGGNFSEESVELAIRKARAAGRAVRIDEILEEAEAIRRKEEKRLRDIAEARKQRLTAAVRYKKKFIDPFRAFNLEPARERAWDVGKVLTPKQRALLLRQGINCDEMPYHQARQVLNQLFHRWKNKLATVRQCNALRKFGYDPTDMTMKQASQFLDALAKNRWKKLTPEQEKQIYAVRGSPDSEANQE